ncbi:hypothetical protein DPMN_040408 [Dreissena polymorpha]|uniref:Uncharacterized protein n=1 Tax=Dreissena polymorpha TaxID=45954 RepID=A0A9D4CXM6_DREPO|nr:hypothetical protein DPMN_040408 [Dreissena polymorpha]
MVGLGMVGGLREDLSIHAVGDGPKRGRRVQSGGMRGIFQLKGIGGIRAICFGASGRPTFPFKAYYKISCPASHGSKGSIKRVPDPYEIGLLNGSGGPGGNFSGKFREILFQYGLHTSGGWGKYISGRGCSGHFQIIGGGGKDFS